MSAANHSKRYACSERKMGKKRQRSAVEGGQEKKTEPQKPAQNGANPSPASESVAKKHKKAPFQLKVISMRGATTAPQKKEPEPAAKPAKPSPEIVKSAEPSKKSKKKKNKNKATAAEPQAGQPLKASAKKANTEDIDDLFKSLKTKKLESAQAAEREAAEAAQAKKKERKERERLEEQIKLLEAQSTNFTAVQGKNPDPRPVRYDEDGLPIYSEDSLQINKGGDTADCPFDCWCCF